MDLVSALGTLLANGFGHVRLVAWDLDETLGPKGGWIRGGLDNYVSNREELTRTIKWLGNKGVRSVIVSRNSGFCGDDFRSTACAATKLGFHGTAKCPRKRMDEDKASIASEMSGVPVSNIMLVDDLEHECRAAAAIGGQALWVPHGPAIHTVPQGKFALFIKNKRTHRVNRVDV